MYVMILKWKTPVQIELSKSPGKIYAHYIPNPDPMTPIYPS